MAKNGPDGELKLDKLPDPCSRYELGPKIASGMLAEVFEAIDKEAGRKKVAVKVVRLEKEAAEFFQEEYRVLKDLSHHPNLPDFYGVYLKKGRRSLEPDQLWFVMELCEGGTVVDLVRHLQSKNRRMTEEHIAYVLKEAVKALVNFHENHVMHRDVKASNILLTKEGEVKLVGFQLSRKLRGTMDRRQTCIGSPCWMAPEVVTGSQREGEAAGYDSRADVWALGVTAIELGDGRAPFQDMHPTRALFQIVRNPPPTLYRPSNWSQLYNDFIAECLEKNPDHRPFVVELMEHPFITSVPENDYHLAQELKALLPVAGSRKAEAGRPESFVRRGLLKSGPAAPLEPMRVEDLAALEDVREDSVLLELHERLRQGRFHTFVGDVLLVLNPNEQQDIYDDHYHVKYQSRSRSDNEPHIYAVADRAYQDAMHHEEPQHILLAGESLSGKTTNFRHLLRHLCFLGKGGGNMGEKLESALDVIHALGNAATPINPDSTRNLLQLDVTYTSTGKLSGAIFWLFQLEKWRVSCSDRHQANFHIFYYLYDAMEAQGRLGSYKLERGRRHRYLRTARQEGGAECARGPREDPAAENERRFQRLQRQLAELDFEDEQRETLWCLLAAVLVLGEIQFRDTGDKVAEVSNPEVASNAAWLLGVEEKKFIWALTNYCVVEKGTAVRRRHTASQAEEARDALANGIYFRVVDWVVNVINLKLSFTRAVFGDKYSISLMDLFGFECFKKNSLEQLFVNTINEQLQYHYTQRMFVWEMQEQEEEEIPLQTLQFYDNKATVDELMAKPSGLLYLLDEASRSSRGSELIIDTLKSEQQQNRRVRATGRSEFTVAHYTGKVTYCAQQLADKNRDFLPPEMIETLRLSADHVVQKLFTNQLSRTGNLTLTSEERGAIAGKNKGRWGKALVADNQAKPRKFNTESQGEYSQTRRMRTAAAVFRGACLELLRSLSAGGGGGTHFVRCVRTDLSSQPRGFQPDVVRQQLRALAVLETARARQRGYPHRVSFPEFIRRYKFLAFDFDENVDVTKDNCRLLLVRLKMEGWVIGKSKVFLKYYNEEYLSRTYESQVKKIIKVQTMMRAFLAKKNVASKMLKFRQNTVDSVGSKQSTRRNSVKYTEETAAVMIQKQFRGYKTRKEYEPLLKRESGKLDTSTAAFIQQYCKKWKAKTIFQVLLMYRAARYQDFVYFSQQVHLYNQKAMTGLQNSNNEAVSLEQVDPGERASLMMPKRKPSVWKLPFRLDDVPYFDTTYLCDPLSSQGNKFLGGENDQESWDAPLRRSYSKPWREKHLHLRDQEVQTSPSPVNENECFNSADNIIEVPFNRDPKQAVPRKQLVTQENQRRYADNMNKMSTRSSEQNKANHSGTATNQFGTRDFNSNRVISNEKQSNNNFRPYTGSSYPRSDLPRPYHKSNPVPTTRNTPLQDDNRYHQDFDNNFTESWNFPRSTSPSFKSKNEYNRQDGSPVKKATGAGHIKNPIEELKMKSRQMSNDSEADDPPFNFQAMLRKTNTNRASLRRGHEQHADNDSGRRDSNLVYSSPGRDDSPPPSYTRTSSSNSWQGMEGDKIMEELESVVNEMEYAEEETNDLPVKEMTTMTELAPGIVVQGLVAEL